MLLTAIFFSKKQGKALKSDKSFVKSSISKFVSFKKGNGRRRLKRKPFSFFFLLFKKRKKNRRFRGGSILSYLLRLSKFTERKKEKVRLRRVGLSRYYRYVVKKRPKFIKDINDREKKRRLLAFSRLNKASSRPFFSRFFTVKEKRMFFVGLLRQLSKTTKRKGFVRKKNTLNRLFDFIGFSRLKFFWQYNKRRRWFHFKSRFGVLGIDPTVFTESYTFRKNPPISDEMRFMKKHYRRVTKRYLGRFRFLSFFRSSGDFRALRLFFKPFWKRALWGIRRPTFSLNQKYLKRLPHFRPSRSAYGLSLLEKQKLKFFYLGLKERKIKYFLKKAQRMEGGLLQNFLGLLESRLGTLVYRCNFCKDIFTVLRFIRKGYFAVNGVICKDPNFELQPGDVFSLSSLASMSVKRQCVEVMRKRSFFFLLPTRYVEFSFLLLKGVLYRRPSNGEVFYPFRLNPLRVLRFYNIHF